MEKFAVWTVESIFLDSTSEKQMAESLKNTFTEEYGPTWNVVVGKQFGSNVKIISYALFSLQNNIIINIKIGYT